MHLGFHIQKDEYFIMISYELQAFKDGFNQKKYNQELFSPYHKKKTVT